MVSIKDKMWKVQLRINKNILVKMKAMQKEIDNNWRELTYYEAHIKSLDKRIKKLEKDNEIDLDNIKVGGTDDENWNR